MERLVVGIDAGGTTVRLLLESVSGKEVWTVQGNRDPDGGPQPVAPLLTNVLTQASCTADKIAAVCAGITKVSRKGVAAAWEAELARLLPGAAVKVVPDYVIAFHGAIRDGVGIGVVAGTGSVVYGENGRGGAVRVGGRGWEFGDEGSGAWLTSEAVRRTLRALDGIEAETPLTRAVCDALETTDAATLGEAARAYAQGEYGRGFLVPLLLKRARSGDTEAVNLFVGAGGWLAAQVRAVQQRLPLSAEEPFGIAAIGGLWSAGDLLKNPFMQVVHRWMPEAFLLTLQEAPVEGAARMAQAMKQSGT